MNEKENEPTDEPGKFGRNVIPGDDVWGEKCMNEIRKTAITIGMEQEAAPDNKLEVLEDRLKRCERYYEQHGDPYGVNGGVTAESLFQEEIRDLERKIDEREGNILLPSYSSEIVRIMNLIAKRRREKMEYYERVLKEEELYKRNGGE